MKERYTCGICGKQHIGLDEYLKCVSSCGEKTKKEQKEAAEKKRIEELNASLNRVKQARAYFEQQLKEFKDKYPEEYNLNFENCSCNSHKDCGTKDTNDYFQKIEVKVVDDGKGKPKVDAKVNGKKDENLEKLFADPDAKYIAKMLGIL